MSLPLRAVGGLLLVAMAATPFLGCQESASDSALLLNLGVSDNRSNVADRDDLGRTPLVTVTANAPGASDSHFVGVALTDFAEFHDTGGIELTPAESFTLIRLTNGKGTAGARCSGNSGTATVNGFLLDASGEPVGEASTTFECYLDDPSRYRLTLSLDEAVAPVGGCIEASVQGSRDNGQPAEGLNATIGCDGCYFRGQDASELDAIPAGELNEKAGLFLDGTGTAKAELCCAQAGRVGVRADWDGDQYGDPDRTENTAFDCIPEGGEPAILVNPDPIPPLRVGTDEEESLQDLQIRLVGPGGAPVEGGTINFIQTSLGMLALTKEDTPPPNTPANKTLQTVSLDDEGSVTIYLWAGIKAGLARIDLTAAVEIAGQDDLILKRRVEVPIIGLGEIECIPPSEKYLTIAGSGGTETVNVCFQVTSTEGDPLPNFPVDFQLPTVLPCQGNPSSCGTAWIAPTRQRTLSDGRACTVLHAGRSAQPVSVRAVGRLHGATLVSDCPAIPVVGGRPSARGLGLVCRDLNVGALMDTDGISSLINHEVPCVLSLKDRFGNPVPQPTDVTFRTEAGTITHSVRTPGRGTHPDGSGESPEISQAGAVFTTFGELPKDVAPLPRDADVGRDRAEPSYEDAAGRVHNPRDGLVTIIAYAVGEEEFTDLDGDGSYTPGEPFVDQAEPFVDFNDNGLRDLDEDFIDFDPPVDPNVDCAEGVARRSRQGIHDGPNGCWDANGLIWTQTRILFTSGPYSRGDSKTSGFLSFGLADDDPRFRLQKVDTQAFKVRIVDDNLNLLNPSARIELLIRGAAEIIQGATGRFRVPDSLGMGFDLRKICNRITGVCAIAPRITGFTQWSEEEGSGYDFVFTAGSNAPPDGPCCAPRPAPGSQDPPELLPEDRRDEKCQPPPGFVFPDEVPEPAPEPEGGEGEGEAAAEGEGEAPDLPEAWHPALFEDTLMRVTVVYEVSDVGGGGPWQESYEIQGWGCGTTVLETADEDDIEAATSCLSGRVLGARAVPIEGAVVTILDPDQGFDPVPSVTNAEGEYCLISSLGRHEIQAEFEAEDGFRCRSQVGSVQIEVGDSDCDGDCRAGPVLECEAIEGEGGGNGGGGDGGDNGDGGGDGGDDGGQGDGGDGGDGDGGDGGGGDGGDNGDGGGDGGDDGGQGDGGDGGDGGGGDGGDGEPGGGGG